MPIQADDALAVLGRVPAGVVFMAAPTLESLRTRQQDIQAESQTIIDSADESERDLNDDDLAALEANRVEAERIGRQIVARETVAVTAAPGANRRTVSDSAAMQPANGGNGGQRATVAAQPRREDPRNGFRNLGEFALAVRNAGRGHEPDARLRNAATTYSSEGVGADGGFAVPPDMRSEIMSKVFAEESLINLTDKMTSSSNSITMPVDMTTPWQTTGGIQAYWIGEAQIKPQSKIALEDVTVRLNNLAALVPVTEELLEDAPALDGYLRRKVPEKMDFKISYALVWGNGVGMPLGFMNSPALVTVPAEGSQPADTINVNNVLKMLARMPVASRRSAVWLIHPDAELQLPLMTVGNQPVYMPPGGISQAAYGSLFGRPIIPHQVAETVGDLGDIMLVDFSQYMSVVKTGGQRDSNGLRTDVSIHLWFDQDMVAYRFTVRVGGQPWWSTSTPMRDGSNAMSPFVTLAAR